MLLAENKGADAFCVGDADGDGDIERVASVDGEPVAERDGAGSLGLWDSDGLEAALVVKVGLVEMVVEPDGDCVEVSVGVSVGEAESEGLAVQLRVSDEVGVLL